MAQNIEDSDQESRTASVGVRRRAQTGENDSSARSSRSSSPRKRRRTGRQAMQEVRELPKGAAFSSLPPQLSASQRTEDPIELSDDSTSSRASSQLRKSQALPAMNWNKGTNKTIRTSLRGGSSSQNNTAPVPQAPIGFGGEEDDSAGDMSMSSGNQSVADKNTNQQLHQNARGSQPSSKVVTHETVSISDDSDSESVDDSAIMLNIAPHTLRPTSGSPVSISDDEDNGGSESGEIGSAGSASSQVGPDTQGTDSKIPTPGVSVQDALQVAQLDGISDESKIGTTLGDLNEHDLEDQIKYAYFHVSRDQLHQGKPAICLSCFESGHMASACPLRNCEHCGEHDKHESRFCPKYRRCLKCRERGHDRERCPSKLKDNSVPCDLCNSTDHLEDTCPKIWERSGPRIQGPISLFIACCNCGSKTHFVGDCPAQDVAKRNVLAWTLRSFEPSMITNLTLQPEIQKAESVQNSFGPKPNLRIRGRADRYGGKQSYENDYQDSDADDDDQFFRAPVNNHPAPRHIRFNDSKRRNGGDERDGYRADSNAYDSYQPSYRDRRDDNPFDYRRPRSRSPPRNSNYGGRRNGRNGPDSWKSGGRSGNGSGGNGGQSGRRQPEPYRPMPSAGKKNWDRYRLGG